MSELAYALALMHSAHRRFPTSRAAFGKGGESTRIWFERPGRIRVERDGEGHLPLLEVSDGERHWQYDDVRGTVITAGSGSVFLPDSMFDPSGLLAAHTFEAVGRAEVAGRAAIV